MPTVGSANRFPKIRLVEGAAAATPAAGEVHLYVKADGLLYWKDDAGVEYAVSTGGDVSVHLADTTDAHDASAISVLDTGALLTATDVEAALAELATALAGATAPDADDVAIADAGTYFTGTDVEAALQELGADVAALGAGGADLIPAVVQLATNGTNGTSTVVTIAAAASGQRLIVVVGSNGRDVNPPTCTNVTFTEVLAVAQSTTMYLSVYVGIVAGGSSGTSVTVSATGSNWIFADVYEVPDALTPTAGSSASLTNASMNTVIWTPIGPIAPARGTFYVAGACEDNGSTALHLRSNGPHYPRALGGALSSLIGYAPGGPIVAWFEAATGSADGAAGIVAIT